jgi:2-polyprenyl-6-hydroxyphenyl methylase/3-demethylubiquinone-9 3-methyltransferase
MSDSLQDLYSSQYQQGEWAGPWWYRRLKPFIKDREQMVAEMVPTGTAEFVDLGCGEGKLMGLVEAKVSRAVGLDLLDYRLEIAKKTFESQIKQKKFSFQQFDLNQKLPFDDASVSVVAAVSVIEYVHDPVALLKEMVRILKPGGVLIVEVPNLAFVGERVKLLFGGLIGSANAPGWQGGRLHHFTYDTLSEALENFDLQIQQKRGSGFGAPIRNLWPSLLAADIIIQASKS